MTDIAKLTVQFEAETAKFRKQLEQNNRSLEKFRGDVNKKLGFIRQSFIVGLGTGLGDAFKSALTAIPRFITESLGQADAIQKLNQRLGASTEALSQYKYVADLTGVSFNTLTTGWQRMTRRIAEAAQGTGEAKNALAELGLDVERLNQLAPEEQFEVLADAITSVKNPADQVRLAMKLFDSEGVALLQTMQGGSEAIRVMRDEADSLGLTLDQGTANAAARAKDSMAKLGSASEAAGIVLINTLGPVIESVANWLQNDLPNAVQFTLDAFAELQIFIAKSGRFVTGALATIEYKLADIADAAGFERLGRAFRQAGDDYKEFADNFGRVTVRLQRTKLEIPSIGSNGVTGPGRFGEIFNQDIADDYTPGGSKKSGLTDQQKELNKILEEGRRLTESLLTPQEAYAAQIENLNRLRESGAISQETYNRAVADYQDQLDHATGVTERFADLQKVIAEVDPVAPLLDQLGVLEDLIAAYPEYGDIIAEQMLRVQEEIDKVNEGLSEQKDEVKETTSEWEGLGPIMSSAFEDAIVSGNSFKDILQGIGDDLLRLTTRNLITKPFEDALGGIISPSSGGGLGGFFSGLFGFANGGSFTVGGAGGTDSQLVAFRATPGETVEVKTPGQSGGQQIVNNFSFVLPSDTVNYRRTAEQVAREASKLMRNAQGAV